MKINWRYKAPQWKDVLQGGSYHDYLRAIGTEKYRVVGRLGRSGKQVHVLVLKAVDTPDGLGIVNAYTFCGSQHFGNEVMLLVAYPISEEALEDISRVTCERCLKRMR